MTPQHPASDPPLFAQRLWVNWARVLCFPPRFCTDCKNKVLRAYNILIGELDCSKEKGYCAALYEGLRCCPHERHIHVCCETDFIAHLLGRAEPEFAGGYEYVIG